MNAPSSTQVRPPAAASRLAWRRHWSLGAKIMLPLMGCGTVLVFVVNRAIDNSAQAGLMASVEQRAGLLADTVRAIFQQEQASSDAVRMVTAILGEQRGIVRWSIAEGNPPRILATHETSSHMPADKADDKAELVRTVSWGGRGDHHHPPQGVNKKQEKG